MRSLAARLLIASVALGAAVSLSAQAPGPGKFTLGPARDVTLLTGPQVLSPPLGMATSTTPNREWNIANPAPAPAPLTQPLTPKPLQPVDYELSGGVRSGNVTVSHVSAMDRSAAAQARLNRLREQREAASARKAQLDAEIERLQREQEEIDRLEAELKRLKREKRSSQP